MIQDILTITPIAMLLTIIVKTLLHQWYKRSQYLRNTRILLVTEAATGFQSRKAREVKVTWEIQQILGNSLQNEQGITVDRGTILVVDEWENNSLPPMAFTKTYAAAPSCKLVRLGEPPQKQRHQMIVITESPIPYQKYQDIIDAEAKMGNSPAQRDIRFRSEINLLAFIGGTSMFVNALIATLL